MLRSIGAQRMKDDPNSKKKQPLPERSPLWLTGVDVCVIIGLLICLWVAGELIYSLIEGDIN